jgi:hypothetical protein
MDSVDVTTFPEAEDAPTRRLTGSRDPSAPPVTAQPAQVMASTSDERCAECGAPMAPDQRYCVECGERRGERRFPAAVDTTSATPFPQGPDHPSRSRMSPSSTLIAGVGTLLLALGVGVLIGRSGTSSSNHGAGSGVQVVTVGSGGSAGAATSATGTTGTGATGSAAGAKSTTAKSASSKAVIKPPKPSSLPPPTVKVGSKGTGKGYKNGHFTGEFFGEEE